jgi:sugar phosphate isomerase/epimerase
MKTSIVLSTHATRFDGVALCGDLEANLLKIAALGYDGVELTIRDPRLIEADTLLSALDAFGLSVPAIGTGQAWGEEGLSFTDPDESLRKMAIRRVYDHIPFAARTGAAIIIGLLRGRVKPGVDPRQATTWLVDALKRCSAAAAPHGVRLVLEPINRYETTLVNTVVQCLDLIAAVGAPNLGMLPDTFHMNIEEPSIADSLRQAGSHIYHVHLADSNRWYPGAGHIDFREIVSALQEIGYTGYLSVEAMAMPDAETCAYRSMRTLRQVLPDRGDDLSRCSTRESKNVERTRKLGESV